MNINALNNAFSKNLVVYQITDMKFMVTTKFNLCFKSVYPANFFKRVFFIFVSQSVTLSIW